MSDSAASSANLTRMRDNQRRSRQRRREYLQELEEKYRECERRGVEASAEVQAAARKVLEENRKLRALLKSKGMSDADIDEVMLEEGELQFPSSSGPSLQLEATLNARRPCCPETELERSLPLSQTERSAYRNPGPSTSSMTDNAPRLSPISTSSTSSQGMRQATISPAITQPSSGYPQSMPTYLDPMMAPSSTLPYAPHPNNLSLHEGWSSYGLPFNRTSQPGYTSTTATTMRGVNTTAGQGVNPNMTFDEGAMFDGLGRFSNETPGSRWL